MMSNRASEILSHANAVRARRVDHGVHEIDVFERRVATGYGVDRRLVFDVPEELGDGPPALSTAMSQIRYRTYPQAIIEEAILGAKIIRRNGSAS
jgi:hypothetical protein